MRTALYVVLLLSVAAPAWAEWQIKAFAGMKLGGSTNLVADLDDAAGKRKPLIGISGAVLSEVFGVEIDLGHISGYFNNGEITVVSSGLTTLTGNVMIALPRRMTEYTLRPYFVAGAGFLRRSITTQVPGVYDGSRNLPAMNVGAGATGFLSRNVGINWDVRRFSTLPSGAAEPGTTSPAGATEEISFWRAHMALAIRY